MHTSRPPPPTPRPPPPPTHPPTHPLPLPPPTQVNSIRDEVRQVRPGELMGRMVSDGAGGKGRAGRGLARRRPRGAPAPPCTAAPAPSHPLAPSSRLSPDPPPPAPSTSRPATAVPTRCPSTFRCSRRAPRITSTRCVKGVPRGLGGGGFGGQGRGWRRDGRGAARRPRADAPARGGRPPRRPRPQLTPGARQLPRFGPQ
jgi:hypothetical protein